MRKVICWTLPVGVGSRASTHPLAPRHERKPKDRPYGEAELPPRIGGIPPSRPMNLPLPFV
jgi:hypothetical protein